MQHPYAIMFNIKENLDAINKQITKLLQHLPKVKPTSGTLRVAHNKGCPQFYHMIQKGDTNGTYIPKSDAELITSLAQKDYNEKCQRILKKMQKQINAFLRKFHPEEFSALHTKLGVRRDFITPLILTDDEFAAQWQATPYTRKTISGDVPQLVTTRGEHVRSKSECIIADTLARLEIPYRYEAPLKISVGANSSKQSKCMSADKRTVTFHPDFTCLNKRTRQEFIWEHFGMMDVANYAKNAVEKERIYANAGFIPGVNFIASTEVDDIPLNSKYVEQLAKKLLL